MLLKIVPVDALAVSITAMSLTVWEKTAWCLYVRRTEADTSVLFELIAHRYEINSLLITCNQAFSEWDSIFADATMTVAAVDRLVHHGTIVEIQQESFLQQQALNRKQSP